MVEHNVIGELTMSDVPSIHPNRTIGLATAPTVTTESVMNNLRSLGMSAVEDLPKRFDWRKQKGIELCPIINQGHCGNCWAVSATTTFADRWMIASGGKGLVLDPLPTTVCTKGNKCGGGLPENCQEFFQSFGASEANKDACLSWASYCSASDEENCCKGCKPTTPGQIPDPNSPANAENHPIISCEELKCKGGFKAKEGMLKSGTVTSGTQINNTSTIHSIKSDIRLHGPVTAKYRVFADFVVAHGGLVVAGGKSFQWEKTNGVYINGEYDSQLSQAFKSLAQNTPHGDPQKIQILSSGLMPTIDDEGILTGSPPSQTPMGFHAVEIVGWDVDDKWGEYWIVKNSWGSKWNNDGYFKFGMNTDGKTNAQCGMDIPIATSQLGQTQLFGGTVSFIPDVSSNPWKGWKGDTDKSGNGIKWWIWVLIGIILIAFFYFIFVKLKSSSRPYSRPYLQSVSRQPQIYSKPSFNPRAYSPNV